MVRVPGFVMALQPGDLIDQKYRIVRLLGEGGMGAVYEGENTRIHRRVAIKVLHSSVAESQDAVARFEREAQAAGRIGSEHIVEVLDLGHLPSGDRYMVMEFLDGQALSERIQVQGRLPPQVLAPIAIELLEGLSAAHEAGIIHRDLKPDNVFLLANRTGHKDFVKILDFGISKFNTIGNEFSMTRTGAVMGTPYYMSPEQAKGARTIDARADIYAVGVILYEATAGEVPFNAETFNELLFKIVLESPMPLVQRIAGLDASFAAIVEKAMARDPGERYQSAQQLQEALRSWVAGAPAITEATLSQGTPLALAHTHLGEPVRSPAAEEPAGQKAKGEQKTQGTWAATGDYGGGKSPSRWPLWLGAAALVVLVGGAGYAVSRSNSKQEARLAAERAEERAEAEQRAEQLRIEAERARAEAERTKAAMERLAAEASQAEKERLEAERKAAEKLAVEAEEAARQARPAAPRPRPAAPAPAPKKAEPSAPAGRVIRTDL